LEVGNDRFPSTSVGFSTGGRSGDAPETAIPETSTPARRLADGAESKTKGCQTDWLIVLGSDQLDQSVRKGTAPAQIIVPANKLLIVNLISFG
jgi:hypothetical protein